LASLTSEIKVKEEKKSIIVDNEDSYSDETVKMEDVHDEDFKEFNKDRSVYKQSIVSDPFQSIIPG